MKYTLNKLTFKNSHFKPRTLVVLVGIAIIVVGVSGLVAARTVSYFATAEADNGTPSGYAQLVSDDTATAGQALQFGAEATQPAATAGFPAPHNTGYPHGLPGDTRTPVLLTPYAGNCNVTVANTVIDSKDITCQLNIKAPGVVVKNSRIRVGNSPAVHVTSAIHATVIDTELDGLRQDNSTGGISLVGDGSYTLIRVNAHSSGDILRANWGGVAVVDSWLHDTYCLKVSCHNDVSQTSDGNCTLGVDSIDGIIPGTSDTSDGQWCLKFVHNRLENPSTQTSNFLLKADQGHIHDVLIENNLLNGGGYTVYWYDSGFQVWNATIRNNRFMRTPLAGGYWPKGGYYGATASNVKDTARLPIWTNNVWADNNQPVLFK